MLNLLEVNKTKLSLLTRQKWSAHEEKLYLKMKISKKNAYKEARLTLKMFDQK